MPKLTPDDGPPLICILCPGNKRFSDLSHLLTHLNSKGHLQSKHKLELRCGTDCEAKNTLDRFAQWYHDNNFGGLLTERMQPKDKKKYVKTKMTRSKKEKKVKPESDSDDEPSMARINSYHPPEPQLNPLIKRSESFNDDWNTESCGTPQRNPIIPHFTRDDTVDRTPIDPSLSDGSWRDLTTPQGSGSNGKPTILTLKGEVFDGMDVFDSATPRTKKRRNQRKGPQVMQQMMKNSADVEPEERSYHASGELRSSRYIYDLPSEDGSPDRRITPSPPKRRKTPRVALKSKSTNKLINVPKLQPVMRPTRSISLITPSKRSALLRDSCYSAAFTFAGDFGPPPMNQTINPFNLFLQPMSQSGFTNGVFYEQPLAAENHTTQGRFDQQHGQSLGQKARLLNTSDLNHFRSERPPVKVEAWDDPQHNPLIAYKDPNTGFFGESHHGANQASPFAELQKGSNHSEKRPLTDNYRVKNKLDDRLDHVAEVPKGPRAGFFKTATSWSTLQPRKPLSTVAKKVSEPGPAETSKIVVQSTQTESSEPHSQQSRYSHNFSPNMVDRTIQSLFTPVTKTKQITQSDAKKRKHQVDFNYIEEEILATPRYNLRQAPSSSLRSTARSPHSSARCPPSAVRLHYGSDLDLELFDEVGGSFKF